MHCLMITDYHNLLEYSIMYHITALLFGINQHKLVPKFFNICLSYASADTNDFFSNRRDSFTGQHSLDVDNIPARF